MGRRQFSETNALDAASLPVTDVYRWAQEQAAHLRAGRLDALDISRIADEIETVGRSEYDALVSNLSVILMHMLKWDHQPERRTRFWALSISGHRDRVIDRLSDSPSLKPRLGEAIVRAYRYSRKDAAGETGLPLAVFPAACPYSWDEIMERPFSSEAE